VIFHFFGRSRHRVFKGSVKSPPTSLMVVKKSPLISTIFILLYVNWRSLKNRFFANRMMEGGAGSKFSLMGFLRHTVHLRIPRLRKGLQSRLTILDQLEPMVLLLFVKSGGLNFELEGSMDTHFYSRRIKSNIFVNSFLSPLQTTLMFCLGNFLE